MKTALTIVAMKKSIATGIPNSSPNTTTKIDNINTEIAIVIRMLPSINKETIPSELDFAIRLFHYKI